MSKEKGKQNEWKNVENKLGIQNTRRTCALERIKEDFRNMYPSIEAFHAHLLLCHHARISLFYCSLIQKRAKKRFCK